MKLDLNRLKEVAESVAESIRDGNWILLNKAQVRSMIEDAVRNNLVSLEDLHPKVKDGL